MKISFTPEEIQEVRKLLTVMGLDISSLGGLSENKPTLYIKPTTICQQFAVSRHEISKLGPIKSKALKSAMKKSLKEGFEGSMMAK